VIFYPKRQALSEPDGVKIKKTLPPSENLRSSMGYNLAQFHDVTLYFVLFIFPEPLIKFSLNKSFLYDNSWVNSVSGTGSNGCPRRGAQEARLTTVISETGSILRDKTSGVSASDSEWTANTNCVCPVVSNGRTRSQMKNSARYESTENFHYMRCIL
jgi:hypothetical protein